MKKTKIVCTIGPASENEEIIRELIKWGMNVARLNTSHGDFEEHRRKIKRIKEIREELDLPIGILLDLAGPKIRTGYLERDTIVLRKGQELILTTEDIKGNEKKISVNYKGLPLDVKPGDRILLSDGAISLRVVEILSEKEIKTVVENGGMITHRRGVNVPGVELKGITSITKRDEEFIEFGVKEEVDMFALSFVRKAEDVTLAKKIIKKYSGQQPVIAKIETLQALENLEEIIEEADGVMVARGDLGVEIPLERVPIEQKRIISTANRMAKPVITATQMLESMIDSLRPTRAEATDVANAILDGTDAVMLSEETAVGKYPVEAVKYMSKIAEETDRVFEEYKNYAFDWYRSFSMTFDTSDAISRACWQLSEDLGTKTIITFTSSGSTARRIARFRPRSKIVAPTPKVSTYYCLSLVWGVVPLLIDNAKSTDEMIEKAIGESKKRGLVESGEKVIITAGIPIGFPGTTNMIKVHEVE
jgi:pyruvate kinase